MYNVLRIIKENAIKNGQNTPHLTKNEEVNI